MNTLHNSNLVFGYCFLLEIVRGNYFPRVLMINLRYLHFFTPFKSCFFSGNCPKAYHNYDCEYPKYGDRCGDICKCSRKLCEYVNGHLSSGKENNIYNKYCNDT